MVGAGGGVPERVVDGVTGFVHADPQKFADAALSILSDDALWRRQHEAALKLQQGCRGTSMPRVSRPRC